MPAARTHLGRSHLLLAAVCFGSATLPFGRVTLPIGSAALPFGSKTLPEHTGAFEPGRTLHGRWIAPAETA
jgi:hypothetical protein